MQIGHEVKGIFDIQVRAVKNAGKCQTKLCLLGRGKLIIATSCDGDIAAPVDGCDNCTLHCLWRASARYTITPTYFYLHPNQF